MQAEDAQQLAELIHGTPRSWRALLDQRLNPFGFSQSRWRVLLTLRHADDSINQIELAKRIGIEPASLVALLDRLESEGWLERIPDPTDRRSKLILLTTNGKKTATRLFGVAVALRGELLESIPERDLVACMRTLTRIRERAEAALANVAEKVQQTAIKL